MQLYTYLVKVERLLSINPQLRKNKVSALLKKNTIIDKPQKGNNNTKQYQ